MGGAVFSKGGSVTITNSTLTGNTAQGGEGLYQLAGTGGNPGDPQDGQGLGGGVFDYNGTLTVTNSTLSGNTANQGGRGIYIFSDGTQFNALINNTIIGQSDTSVSDLAIDSTGSGGGSVHGAGNLVRTTTVFGQPLNILGALTGDPMLGPLQNNGGPTQTMALPQFGSPAIDAGSNSAIPAGVTTDQRGSPRILDGTVDIGAYEDGAANIVVNTTADYRTSSDNNTFLSLREALDLLNGTLSFSALSTTQQKQVTSSTGSVATITFDSTLDGDTIALSYVGDSSVGSSAFLVNSDLAIDGPSGGSGITLAVAAGTKMRLFDVAGNGNLTLQNLTLSGGTAQGSAGGTGKGGDGLGGAIYTQGRLTILDSTLTGNTAQGGNGGGAVLGFDGGNGKGGAVFNEAGTVAIDNSTFYSNTASGGLKGTGTSASGNAGQGLGGGLFNHNGNITVTNSTFSANTAAQGGRDIVNFSDGAGKTGTANINNSILGQSGATTITDFVSLNSGGNAPVNAGVDNLMSNRGTFPAAGVIAAADPQLGTLQYHGGPTSTMALLNGSPAINTGTSGPGIPTTDQRGFNRDGKPDIGAFEFGAIGSQTITFSPLTSPVTYNVGPITLSAASSSALGVTFTVLSGPGTISGNTLAFTAAGTIVVEADQAGSAYYNAAPAVRQTLVVNKANQTINFTGFAGTFSYPVSNGASVSSVNYGVGQVEILGGSSSGLGVTYSVVSGPGSISYQSGFAFLNVTGAGSIVVEADQAGNAGYNAAPAVQHTLVVGQASQTITFGALAPVINGVAPFALNATSSSGLAVTYKVVSGPATVSGNTLTVNGGGSIVIEADQAGNASYTAAAAVQQTLVVSAITLLGNYAFVESPAAGNDSDSVVFGGAWTVTSNASWLHATTTSGTGIGKATFSFDTNTGATRTGTLVIANFTLSVTQAGAGYVAANGAITPVPNAAGLSSAEGVAVDGMGNIYIADTFNNRIEKWNATNGLTTLVSSGLNRPNGVAVDGAGNVFIADTNNNRIAEWNAANGLTTLVSGLTNPRGVAVDKSGNVYIADTYFSQGRTAPPPDGGRILEWNATAPHQVSTLVSAGLHYPWGVAVDGAGNVYIADTDSGAGQGQTPGMIDEWNVTKGLFALPVHNGDPYDPNGVDAPLGLAVDGAGNVFIANTGDSDIEEYNATSGLTTTVATYSSIAVNYPGGVAVDGAGNVYIANTGQYGYNGQAGPSSILEVAKAYVPGSPVNENPAAGSDAVAVPTTQALTGTLAPTSDQTWLSNLTFVNGVVNFSFTANTGAARTAHISVLSSQITITQGAVASALGSAALLEGPAAGSDTDSVVASGPWTATSNAFWLHTSAGDTGTGTATFSFDANPGVTRTGTLTINGLTLTVNQAGNGYVAAHQGTTLVYVPGSPVNESAAAGSDALAAVLGATQALTGQFAPTSNQSWLTIGTTVNGVVSFSFTANTGATRTADITLLGQQIAVTQAAGVTIVITPYASADTTYDGTSYTASGTAIDGNGVDLSNDLILTGTTHTNVGIYTDSWSFHDPSGTYPDASGTVVDSIGQATASIAITPSTTATTTYDGTSHTATGIATGVGGVDLSGDLTLTGTTHTAAGTYTDSWSFHDPSGTYQDASGTVTDSIGQASAVIAITGYATTYDGNAHTATGTATGLSNLDLSAGLTLVGTTHTNAGTYTDSWSFHDATGNYADASDTVIDSIARANAVFVITPYTSVNTTYDTLSHTATGTATGLGGIDLSSGLDFSGTTHTNAGTYASDAWSFAGGTNYNDASGPVIDSIAKADATVSVTGYTGMYDGAYHGATGSESGLGGEDAGILTLGADLRERARRRSTLGFHRQRQLQGPERRCGHRHWQGPGLDHGNALQRAIRRPGTHGHRHGRGRRVAQPDQPWRPAGLERYHPHHSRHLHRHLGVRGEHELRRAPAAPSSISLHRTPYPSRRSPLSRPARVTRSFHPSTSRSTRRSTPAA